MLLPGCRFTAAALTLPKFLDAITENKNVEETQRGQVMELTQAFLLGIMVAWTPSLIVLAVLLRDCADPTGPCD